MQYAPQLRFDSQVAHALELTLGSQRLQRVCAALARPSLQTTLQVNTLTTTREDVVRQLQQLLPGLSGWEGGGGAPRAHPVVPSAVVLPGRGPHLLDLQPCGGAEVVIGRLAGEAVLQGAHVFSPGLLAASPGLAAGDLVAVTVAVEGAGGRWCGVNRGARLTPELQAQLPGRTDLCVGVGRVVAGRRELFKQQQGLAVEMVQRVFDTPPCNGLLPGKVLLQSLPCVVAAHVLAPQPGSRVLDMCASPGHKTVMLAQQMAGTGELIALDRTQPKVARIRQLAQQWGMSGIVTAMVADATQLWQQQQQQQQEQALSAEVQAAAAPESFDAVLLDAPCSALGLRPRLLLDGWSLPRLHALAAYQRALITSAVQLLKPGGSLVYCTCTVAPWENEANVRWLLDTWPKQMRLEEQPLVVGGPGLTAPGLLSPNEAALVQRFDPGGGDDDGIGFFIVKLHKSASTTASRRR